MDWSALNYQYYLITKVLVVGGHDFLRVPLFSVYHQGHSF